MTIPYLLQEKKKKKTSTKTSSSIVTYKTAPKITSLRRNILGQTNVPVGVDNSISSKVEPTILKIMV